jgi:hypothetical protein
MIIRSLALHNARMQVTTNDNDCIVVEIITAQDKASVELSQVESDELMLLLNEAKREIAERYV